MTTTDYYARTDDDGSPIYLVRVTDAGAAVDLWNARDAAWVPAPKPSATLASVERGHGDLDAINAGDVAAIIAKLAAPG